MLKCTQRTAQGQQRVISVERKDLRNGGAPVRLQADEVLSFKSDRGTGIQCEAGTLWLTQENDLRDHILCKGKSFIPDRCGRVVVWAMSDALVMLKEINRGEKGAQ